MISLCAVRSTTRLLLWSLCLHTLIVSASDDTPPNTDENCLTANAATEQNVSTISIEQLPIFDESNPEENNWLFRWVNRLHVNTAESVIREDLLFKAGEKLHAEHIAESERLLRTRKYIREPTIGVQSDCAGNATIMVRAREVWTLIPEVGYSKKGGHNDVSFGLKDKSFMGSGKEISVNYDRTIDYTRTFFSYRDPNWGRLRNDIKIKIGQTDEGDFHEFGITRPFYSVDTNHAGSLHSFRQTHNGGIYWRGEQVNKWEEANDNNRFYLGYSSGLQNDYVLRYIIGMDDQQRLFRATAETQPSMLLPPDRQYRFAFIGLEFQEQDFVERRNVNQLHITEDYNLGWQWKFSVGHSDPKWAPVDRASLLESSLEKTVLFGDHLLLFSRWKIDALYTGHHFENAIAETKTRLHISDFERWQWFIGLHANYGRYLTLDNAIYLGGDNGLRAYPLRYQIGDRSALLSSELRWFTDYEVFHLADVAFAAFYDVGRAWFKDTDNGEYGGWLRNAGIGLRLVPTRTGGEGKTGDATVIHIDFAYPLDARDDVGNGQWSLQVKQSF